MDDFILWAIIGVGAAFVLVTIVFISRAGAKKKAKRILEAGVITDMREARQVLRTLAGITDDLEAADLYRELSDLVKKERIDA